MELENGARTDAEDGEKSSSSAFQARFKERFLLLMHIYKEEEFEFVNYFLVFCMKRSKRCLSACHTPR